MKNIVLIYRKKSTRGFSLETQFDGLIPELAKEYGVTRFEMGGAKSLIPDLYKLWKLRADVYHITGDVHYIAPLLPPGKVVLTIHDLGHFKNDLRGLKKLVYKFLWYSLPVKFSRLITVVSQKTFDDLTQEYLIANKVTIVPCSYASDLTPQQLNFNEICPNILQVGTHELKNIPRVLKALSGINCTLTVIGVLDGGLVRALNYYGIKYKSYHNLSRWELLEQYKLADIVTFVSLEEGFGVPVLEAQAVGRPLVVSNIAPMSDNAGYGSCLVDPKNIDEIRHAILRIVNDGDFRRKLVDDGLHNVKRFNVLKITCMYSNIYKKIHEDKL